MPVYSKYTLTNQLPINTYGQLVQYSIESSSFTDGFGNVLTQSINLTASNAYSSSFATTSSYEYISVYSMTSSWASSSISSSYLSGSATGSFTGSFIGSLTGTSSFSTGNRYTLFKHWNTMLSSGSAHGIFNDVVPSNTLYADSQSLHLQYGYTWNYNGTGVNPTFTFYYSGSNIGSWAQSSLNTGGSLLVDIIVTRISPTSSFSVLSSVVNYSAAASALNNATMVTFTTFNCSHSLNVNSSASFNSNSTNTTGSNVWGWAEWMN